MFYYLLAFALALLFTAAAESRYRFRQKWLGHSCAAAAVFVLCWFAGARGNSVGIDTMVYAVPQFFLAQNLPSFFAYYAVCDVELLYALLVYLSAKLTSSPFLLLFASQLLIAVPVMMVAYRKRREMSMTFVMFVYCFLFYNMSLNIMRQLISCAFMLLAYILFSEKKPLRCLLAVVFAVLNHSSAIIACLMYFGFFYATRGKAALWMRLLISMVILGVIMFVEPIASFLINTLHLLPQEYYERIIAKMNTGGLSAMEVGFRSFFVLTPFLLYFRSGNRQQQDYNYFSLFSLIISLAAVVSEYFIRFSYFPQFFFILTLPSVPMRFSQRKYGRVIIYGVMAAVIVAYWYLIYIGWVWHGTVPYVLR